MEPWQELYTYLRSAGCLSKDLGDNPSLVSVAEALQDGTALCRLANRLKPGSCSNFHVKPTRQFQCFQNIGSFLVACKDSFGLAEEILFAPENLFHASEFRTIVATLATLSKTPASINAGFTPFPQSHRHDRDEDYEDLATLLEQQALTKQSTDSIYSTIYSGTVSGARRRASTHDARRRNTIKAYRDARTAVPPQSEEDEIYGTCELLAQDIYGQMVVCDQEYEELKSKSKSNREKRKYAQDEIIDTEERYVGLLDMIDQCYYTPLQQRSWSGNFGMSQAEFQTVFMNLPELREIHHKFLASMREKPDSMGQLFLTEAERFLVYASYCARLPDAVRTIESLLKKRDFVLQIEQCKGASKQRFELKDLLAVPMQRILRYSLLLQELAKYSPKDTVVADACTSMQEVARYINDAKKDREHMQIIQQLSSSIKDYPPTAPSLYRLGHYLLDGDVKLRMQGDGKTLKRYIFLFEKALVVCKSKYSGYTWLFNLRVKDFELAEESIKGKNVGLKLVSTRFAGAGNNCTLIFKSEMMMKTWRNALRDAMESSPPEPAAPAPAVLGSVGTATLKRTHRRYNPDASPEAGGSSHGAHSPLPPTPPESEARAAPTNYAVPAGSGSVDVSGTSTYRPRLRASTHGGQRARDVRGVPTAGPPVETEQQAATPVKSKGMTKTLPPGGLDIVFGQFDFIDHPDRRQKDLRFRRGDEIVVLSRPSEHWWRGRRLKDGTEGPFPASFVGPSRPSDDEGPPRPPKGSGSRGASEADLSGYSTLAAKRPDGTVSLSAGSAGQGQSVPSRPPKSNRVLRLASQEDVVSEQPPPRPPKSNHTRTPSDDTAGRPAAALPPKPQETQWYAGPMSREDAEDALLLAFNGAYIVRERPANPGTYALTLRDAQVRHIRIEQDPDGKVYVSKLQKFASIPEMIQFYQRNNLHIHFEDIHTALVYASGRSSFPSSSRMSQPESVASSVASSTSSAGGLATEAVSAQALYDFDGSEADEITFQAGDFVTVLGKNGFGNGWWFGQTTNGSKGLFPSNYVRELESST